MDAVDNESLYTIHQSSEKGVEFVYKGIINAEIIDVLLDIMKSRYDDLDVPYMLRKRLFVVATECLDNIVRHCDAGSLRDSVFVFGGEGEEFFIATGNTLETDSADMLDSRLRQIMLLERAELRWLLRRRLKLAIETDGHDAGIGLIDMALKARGGITYNMVTVTEGVEFYTIKINLKLK